MTQDPPAGQADPGDQAAPKALPVGPGALGLAPPAAAASEALAVKFTVDRGALHRAWRRVRQPRTDRMVTLALTADALVLETANASVTPSLRAHARVPLQDAIALLPDRTIVLALEADLVETKLCSATLHTIAPPTADSVDPLVFETAEDLEIVFEGSQTPGRLRVRDGAITTIWPMHARYAATTPPDPVPEAAVVVEPNALARAIGLAGRLVRPGRETHGQGRLALEAGLARIEAGLGFCAVRKAGLDGLDLQVGPDDLAALAGILTAQDRQGRAWTDGDRQILRFGEDGCVIARGAPARPLPAKLLDEPSRAAIRVPVHDLTERVAGLLRQPTNDGGEASLTLSGGSDPTLRASVPVEGGTATYTLAAAWISGMPEAGAPEIAIEGRVPIAALLRLVSCPINQEHVDLHLHRGNLELRETQGDGELRAFILCREPPPPATASDILEGF